ncbi:hypothetical protein ACHAWF_000535 [Thalassiosira exigua]
MGCQRNRLVRIQAYTHWIKALEKDN